MIYEFKEPYAHWTKRQYFDYLVSVTKSGKHWPPRLDLYRVVAPTSFGPPRPLEYCRACAGGLNTDLTFEGEYSVEQVWPTKEVFYAYLALVEEGQQSEADALWPM